MSKQPTSPSRHIEADHELQRLRGLSGFHDFEQQLDAGLEKMTQRWANWRGRGNSEQTITRKLWAVR